MRDYVLRIADATNLETGVYQWAFDSQSVQQPKRIVFGPVSVTTTAQNREVTILSDDFQQSRTSLTLRDGNHKILYVVHPHYTSVGSTTSSSSTGGESSGAPTQATVTDAHITGIGGTDLMLWFDLAPARLLSTNFTQAAAVGDLFHYMYNRSPSVAGIVLDANWDFELYGMGTNGAIGVSRDSNPLYGHGMHLTDVTNPMLVFPSQSFHLHHVWKAPMSYNDNTGLFDIGNTIVRVQTNAQGGMKFVNELDSTHVFTNLSWIPGRTYLLSCWRKLTGPDGDGDGVNDAQMHWRHEDLDNGGVQTETTLGGYTYVDGSQWWLRYGVLGNYFRHIGGPLIMVNGTDQVQFDTVQAYMKNWYLGTGDGSSGGESSSSSTAANYTMYDNRERKLELRGNVQPLQTITLEFQDQAGAKTDLENGTIHIKV